MNNSYQAKNGLKTFIFVFLLSLGVFSIFYYITSYPDEEIAVKTYTSEESGSGDTSVLGVTNEYNYEEETEESADENPFKRLGERRAEAGELPKKMVLAGEDEMLTETEESTVPETGLSETTLAFLISITLISVGAYAVLAHPREFALNRFESKMKKF